MWEDTFASIRAHVVPWYIIVLLRTNQKRPTLERAAKPLYLIPAHKGKPGYLDQTDYLCLLVKHTRARLVIWFSYRTPWDSDIERVIKRAG